MLEPALDAARPLLPAAVGYANLIAIPAAFVLAFVSCAVGVRVASSPLRSAASAAWWERARAAYPAGAASWLLLVLVPVIVAVSLATFGGPMSRVPPRILHQGTLVAGVAGGVAPRLWALRKVLGRRLSLGTWCRGWLTQAAFHPTLLALLATVPCADLGVRTLWAGAVAVALSWIPLWLPRWFGIRRSPRLLAIVERVAAGSPLAGTFRAFEVDHWVANAFAFPGRPLVFFTKGALDALPDEEIEAICTHELAHTHEPRSIRWARRLLGLAPSLFLLGVLAVADGRGMKRVGVALLVAAIVLALAKSRLSQRWEAQADAAAGANETSSGLYGRALQHLHELNATPLVLGAKGTHGHPYDRLAAARVALPPRPRPPSSAMMWLALLVGAASALSLAALFRRSLLPGADASDGALVRAVVVTGGHGDELLALGSSRSASDDPNAAVFFRAAVAADPESIDAPVCAARAYGKSGNCEGAAAMLAVAEKRAKRNPRRDEGAPLADVRHEVATCNPLPDPGSDRRP